MTEGVAVSGEVLKRILACSERACHESFAEGTVESITATVKELLGARAVALVVLDHENDCLTIAGAQGLSKQFVRAYRRMVGTSTVGEVIWNDRKVLVESAETGGELDELKMEMEFASVACVRVATEGRPMGFLWADSAETGAFKAEDLVVMRLLANLAGLAVERDRMQAAVRKGTGAKGTSVVDSYSYFHRRLTEEIERSGRLNERMSLLLVAVDGAGDSGGEFFEEVSVRVKAMMRAIDVVGRYGAGQLVLYLPETNGDSAVKAAERIRGMVERMGKEKDGDRTASIGLATLPENGETVEQLMNALTSALFKAQQAGGNRVSGPAEMYVV